MIKSKLLYGLEMVELIRALLSKFEVRQLRGLRKLLHLIAIYTNRRNSNM